MTTDTTAPARTCGPECSEAHTYAGPCLLAPLYPSIELDALRSALEEVRTWRHRQPHVEATRYLELDAILDRAALGQITRQLDQDAPASLPEAVTAHHRIMAARRRTLEDARRVWDAAEAAAIRQIARFMPAPGVKR
ncbi:hypothetical protein ACH4YN_37915 [Streptomyces griseofuscus]|uniref:hypothetical protein n=1 Tax=Streptomyces griseofuscus TaxID=146922 RepID=UPI0037AF3107